MSRSRIRDNAGQEEIMITCYELMQGPELVVTRTYDCSAEFAGPENVAAVCREVFNMGELAEEKVILFALSGKRIMGVFELSKGNADSSLTDVQSIFTRIFLCGVKHFIIAHNHPSQNCLPSRQDFKVTMKLKQACGVMDCILVDHIIVTRDKLYSFYEKGILEDIENIVESETETKGEESVLRKREEMLCRIQKMIYYFTGEMDLCVGQNKKSRRDETGTQKEDSAEPGLSASTGFCKSSWKELKGCLNDLDDVMNFLKDGQNQVQDWQIAGMNAMLDKCARGRAVPYEVSTAFKGLLRMYG
jgi:hypothetical protein